MEGDVNNYMEIVFQMDYDSKTYYSENKRRLI